MDNHKEDVVTQIDDVSEAQTPNETKREAFKRITVKVLIWLGLITISSILSAWLGFLGITLGAIPTTIIYALILFFAKKCGEKWDESCYNKKRKRQEPTSETDVNIFENCLSIESEQTPINNSIPFDENKKFSADTNIDVGKIQQPETNKKRKSKSNLFSNTLFLNVVILILLLSFSGSLIANIWQYEKMEDLSYENKSLSTKLNLSKERLEESEEAELKYFKLYLQYSDKASFLTEKIAFCNEDDRYYHTFNCDSFSKTESYWAHNTEYAEWLGYEPHYCWEK